MSIEKCEATVQHDWHQADCQRSGTQKRLGHRVCGTHARQYDKWVVEGRGPVMAEYWWKWRGVGDET